MKLDAKNLRINSFILIVLTVLSAISLVGRILANEISTAAFMERGNITAERANIYVAIIISVCCLLYLLTLIIGIRGFSQANGKCGGKANVILGTILLILSSISDSSYDFNVGDYVYAYDGWFFGYSTKKVKILSRTTKKVRLKDFEKMQKSDFYRPAYLVEFDDNKTDIIEQQMLAKM